MTETMVAPITNYAELRARMLATVSREAALSEAFYRHLFELQPAIRNLFPESMSAQQLKFTHTLNTVLQLIDCAVLDPTTGSGSAAEDSELAHALAKLGARHQHYGAQPLHYAAVGEALLHALDEVCQSRLGEAERQAWRRLYAWICMKMLDEAL